MKYRYIKSINKIKWICLLVLVFSCKNYKNIKQEVNTLPTGKWKITQLKNTQQSIVFDTTRSYFLELTTKNIITITAEDNRLSGEIIIVNNDSIKMESVTITDVCCNSEAAELLFKFFEDTIKYEQPGDKLILSSNKALVMLEK